MCGNEVLHVSNGHEMVRTDAENYQWGEVLKVEPPPPDFKPCPFRISFGLVTNGKRRGKVA